jgi:hypothetical protein
MNKAEAVFEKLALSYDKVIASIISRNSKVKNLKGVASDMLKAKTERQVSYITNHLENIVNKKKISSAAKGAEQDAIMKLYSKSGNDEYLKELGKYIKDNKISRI